MPEPGREARPVAREVVVYPGFYAIDQIARQIHRSISAIDNGFNRRVPESAMAYYAAALSYARLLKVLDLSGRPLTHDEDSFMRMIYAGEYSVPALLGYFMDGIGNTKLNQREVRVRASKRTYVRSDEDGSVGWFGKIGPDTHYLYASYPCLAVYATKVALDMAFTNDPNLDSVWELPADIRPEDANAGNATENLLGYRQLVKLTPLQMQWLQESGFSDQGDYNSAHPSIPYLPDLLTAVQTELTGTKVKLVPMNKDDIGSVAQTITTKLPYAPVKAEEGSQNMIATRRCWNRR